MKVEYRISSVQDFGHPDRRVHIFGASQKPLQGYMGPLSVEGRTPKNCFEVKLASSDDKFHLYMLPSVALPGERTIICWVTGHMKKIWKMDKATDELVSSDVIDNQRSEYKIKIPPGHKIYITAPDWELPQYERIAPNEVPRVQLATPPSSEDEGLGSSPDETTV